MILLIIFGCALLFISFSMKNNVSNPFSKYSNILKIVGLVIIGLGVFSGIFKQIDAGRVGVQSLFGNVQSEVLNSGLNIINPLMDVTDLSIQTQNYTMSAIQNEGDKEGDDAIRVLSADGLEVIIDLTVLYRILPTDAPKIIRTLGVDYSDKIVRPITRTRIRDNAVYYDAVALYSTKRNEFQQRIFKSIETDFKSRGLVLEQLLIRNINLPASVKTTIESKINAEQEAFHLSQARKKNRRAQKKEKLRASRTAEYLAGVL